MQTLIKRHGSHSAHGIHSRNAAAFSSDGCPLKLLHCSWCCRRHWDCQASHTHATVKSSAAQHVFQPECDVDEALQTFQSVDLDRPRLLRISLGLQTAGFVSRVVLRPWWFRLGPRFCYRHEININVGYRVDVHEHDQRHLIFLPRTHFHFGSLLFSALRPKLGSSCRHSALSAFRPKMRSAFHPFGIPTASPKWV